MTELLNEDEWPRRDDLLAQLTDAHAHPTDTPRFKDEEDKIADVKCAQVCVMSSNLHNQEQTEELRDRYPDTVVPCFGLHPWFCHGVSIADPLPAKRAHYDSLFPQHSIPDSLFEALPTPIPLENFLSTLDRRLDRDGSMLGEVGLDKSFRIPTTGGHIAPHSMPLTPETERFITYSDLKTPMSHQIAVLEAQLDVAVRRKRNASVHCVAAQGPLVDLLARCKRRHGSDWTAINVDLHSYGGSSEVIKTLQKTHANLYFSFSTTINARLERLPQLIQAVSADRVLVESDWNSAIGSSESNPPTLDVPIIRAPVPIRQPFVEERGTLQPPGVPHMSVSPISAVSPAALSNFGSGSETDEQDDYDPSIDDLSRRASSASIDSLAGPARSVKSNSPSTSRRGSKGGQDKRFRCDRPGCDRVFARRYNLSTHIASTHEQRKPYACTQCTKSFSRRHDLGRHLAAVHDSTQADIAAAKAAQPSPTQVVTGAVSPASEPHSYEQASFVQPGPSSAPFVQPGPSSAPFAPPQPIVDHTGMLGVGLDGRLINPFDFQPPFHYG